MYRTIREIRRLIRKLLGDRYEIEFRTINDPESQQSYVKAVRRVAIGQILIRYSKYRTPDSVLHRELAILDLGAIK